MRAPADWLVEREVDEVVMESTAQYWRPVWEALERYWRPTRRAREGEMDPAALAALADSRLRATPDQLRDAFGACADLHPVYRRLVKLTLDELRLIEDPLAQLDQQMADLLTAHHDAVRRPPRYPALASIPRSRSSRKSVPAPPRSRQRNSSPPGWAHAQVMKRAPA